MREEHSDSADNADSDVAKAIDGLAAEPELRGRAAELLELSAILRDGPAHGSADADPWTGTDLLATFARDDVLAPAPTRRPRLRRNLSLLASSLVFLPLLCTWLGISGAASAYGSMLGDPEGRRASAGHSFLELWQSGFGGRLTGLLDLTHVAVYALVSIGLLIAVTAAASGLRQADEQAAARRREALLSRLVPVLSRAQRALNRRRLDSPARFAAELSLAAHHLGELLEDVDRTQRSTSDLALRNAQASKELRASAASLTTATERLQTTSAAAGAAATALRGVVGRLGDEITGQAADAAARLETSAEAARTELGALQATGRATLREVGDQVEETLAGLAERVSQATDGLVAAGGGFAAEIGASGGRAARDIGHTYQEAVAAAAVDLEEKMILIGERLNTAVREIRETSREQAESARAAAAPDLDAAWRAAVAGGPAASGLLDRLLGDVVLRLVDPLTEAARWRALGPEDVATDLTCLLTRLGDGPRREHLVFGVGAGSVTVLRTDGPAQAYGPEEGGPERGKELLPTSPGAVRWERFSTTAGEVTVACTASTTRLLSGPRFADRIAAEWLDGPPALIRFLGHLALPEPQSRGDRTAIVLWEKKAGREDG
ncbi:hypothetical protein AB0M95_15540 [Sphaerisporangium sp. NPDC051017]|uniref:hypothetical protein n=1 Tax=Sphaerisporangium sp. NPDC051017 TaxID=3154636 RepID=UPI0034138940